MSDRPVQVVPTRKTPRRASALLALDPGMDARRRPVERRVGRSSRSSVTEAVRDATIGGKKVKRGQTIALDLDDGLVAVDNDVAKAVSKAMTALTPGYELVTLFYGDGADPAEAEAMAKRIGTMCPASRWRSATAVSPTTGT